MYWSLVRLFCGMRLVWRWFGWVVLSLRDLIMQSTLSSRTILAWMRLSSESVEHKMLCGSAPDKYEMF